MNTKERLLEAKKRGISLKMIAIHTEININTIYSYNCGKTRLSKEKEEKINKFLDEVLN